jgi:lipoyl-dependent peroxiredoxin
MLERRATAVWRGSGKDGEGTLRTQSGAVDQLPYTAHARFQDEEGKSATNPEELIAAAHAGCFAMALSFQISGAGLEAEELEVGAVVTIEKEGVHWSIVGVRLELRGRVPGISAEKFQELAEAAKAGCPVSKVLNAEITLEAMLEGSLPA